MANKGILVSWQVVPSVKIPFPPLEYPKESKLALAQITKVCWSLANYELAADWATFTLDFHGVSMM